MSCILVSCFMALIIVLQAFQLNSLLLQVHDGGNKSIRVVWCLAPRDVLIAVEVNLVDGLVTDKVELVIDRIEQEIKEVLP